MKDIVFKSKSKKKQVNHIKTELREKVDLCTAQKLIELSDRWECSVGEAIDSVVKHFYRGSENG